MINTILTAAAVLAMSTVVQGTGSAVVVNNCPDPIGLAAVPAAGGGQSESDQQLSPGGSFSQVYTELSNGQGWSIKISRGGDMTDIIQYEYTYHNDGTIWYDLSAVNGDPWNGDWSISASDGCNPRQAAYRYPTDDSYGEQSCPDSATITVTMCSSGGAPAVNSSPVESQAPSTPSAPAWSAAPAGPSAGADKAAGEAFQNLAAAKTVTHVATTVVTQWVTVSPSPVKRSNYIHRHAEHHNHA